MSYVPPVYDLCTSRFCNICLFFETEKQKKGCDSSEIPPADKLRYCSNCKLVMYCSPEHQRFDWPIHREFCRTVGKVMKSVNVKHPLRISGQPFDSITLERNIIQLKYLLRIELKRPLKFHEEELTSFPAHCEICYRFDRLHICMECKAVSYCSPEHEAQDRPRHYRNCAKLKLYYCPYKCISQIPARTLIGDLYRPVYDMMKTDLLGAFQEMTSTTLPLDPTASLPGYHLFSCAGDFSCIGTICFALQFAKMFEYTANKFVIFIVGATNEQDFWFKTIHTKWFFLQFPQIKKLELYFIGPEAVGAANNVSFHSKVNYSVLRGVTASSRGLFAEGVERTVIYKSFRMLFQDFTKQYNIQPSLIVAFNCGFSADCGESIEARKVLNRFGGVPYDGFPKTDTWVEGISQMIHTYEVPIIFTSFTALEADLDYGALLKVARRDCLTPNLKRLFDITRNPYRDVRPFRNWQETFDDPIFYRNNHVQAVIISATRK